jgi:hypothetical protein
LNGYSLSIYPSKNAVLFTKPSVPYLLRNCKKTSKEVAKASVALSVDFIKPTTYEDALSKSLIDIEDDESRQTIKILYPFPESQPITNKIYSRGDDAEGEEVKLFATKVPVVADSKKKLDLKEGKFKWVLEWFVAVVEGTKRCFERDEEAAQVNPIEVELEAAEDRMRAMGLGDDVEELQRQLESQRMKEEVESKLSAELAKLKRQQAYLQEAERAKLKRQHAPSGSPSSG